MNRQVLEETLNAPIPGESLTAELGSFPWQRPSRFSSVNETVQHYSRQLSDPIVSSELVSLLDSGVTVKEISNTLVNASVMEGIHSLDVGVLTAAVVYEMILYLGDEAGVSYSTGLEESSIVSNESKKIMADKIMREFMEDVDESDLNSSSNNMPMQENIEPIEEPASKGLMSRPTMNEGVM